MQLNCVLSVRSFIHSLTLVCVWLVTLYRMLVVALLLLLLNWIIGYIFLKFYSHLYHFVFLELKSCRLLHSSPLLFLGYIPGMNEWSDILLRCEHNTGGHFKLIILSNILCDIPMKKWTRKCNINFITVRKIRKIKPKHKFGTILLHFVGNVFRFVCFVSQTKWMIVCSSFRSSQKKESSAHYDVWQSLLVFCLQNIS